MDEVSHRVMSPNACQIMAGLGPSGEAEEGNQTHDMSRVQTKE